MNATHQEKPRIIYREIQNKPIYAPSANLANGSIVSNLISAQNQEITNQKLANLYSVCITLQTSMDAMQQSINAISDTLTQLTGENASDMISESESDDSATE